MNSPLKVLGLVLFGTILTPIIISIISYWGVDIDEKTYENNEKQIINYETVNKNSPEIVVYNHKTDKNENIDIEKYLYGVLAGEMPTNFDIEALKAQAIAARSYVLHKQENGPNNKHEKAVVCTDHTHCQEYKSYEELKEIKGEDWIKNDYEKIKKAVDETKGQVITYDDKVILPLYFSTSSGKTENSEEVFSGETPYLRSVESPYDDKSPKYVSQLIINKDDFINKLKNSFDDIIISNVNNDVKILSRSEGGSVNQIKVGNKELKGRDIRSIFNLNSSNFDITMNENEIVFDVKGFGHGVGMSQWGANGMAKEGYLYYEILSHYYTGIKIKDLY